MGKSISFALCFAVRKKKKNQLMFRYKPAPIILKFLYWKLIPETRYLDSGGKFEEYSQRTNKLCIIS